MGLRGFQNETENTAHKWLIANRDTAQRVQCICAATFCHLAREMIKEETAETRVCHPIAIPQNPKLKFFAD